MSYFNAVWNQHYQLNTKNSNLIFCIYLIFYLFIGNSYILMQASDFRYHSNDPICRELTLADTLILIRAYSRIPKWWARYTVGLVRKQVNGQTPPKTNSTLHPGKKLQPNKDWEEMKRKHTTAGWAWLGSLDSFPHEHFTVWSLMVVPWMEQIAFVAASFEPNLQTLIMITACMSGQSENQANEH